MKNDSFEYMSPLERELESALLGLYEQWKRYAPPKNYFLQMVKKTENTKRYRGPVGTVRYLLMGDPSSGFRDLVRIGKIDLTVEALILQSKWHSLFTQAELAKAKARIACADLLQK